MDNKLVYFVAGAYSFLAYKSRNQILVGNPDPDSITYRYPYTTYEIIPD